MAAKRVARTDYATLSLFALLGLLVALLAVVLSSKLAAAHYQTAYPASISPGRNVLWMEYTKYERSDKFAVSYAARQWSSFSGEPNFYRVRSGPTLTHHDYYNSGTITQAYWNPRVRPDRIYYNMYHMDPFPPLWDNAVTTHEAGHALDLGHMPNSRCSSVMHYDAAEYAYCTGRSWPSYHDQQDFHARW